MTPATIPPLARAASEALDALAASVAVGAQRGARRGESPTAFRRVLDAETDAADAPAPGPGTSAARDPQPDRGRDDEHAVGRIHSQGRPEAREVDTAANDGASPASTAEASAPTVDVPAAGDSEVDGAGEPGGFGEAVDAAADPADGPGEAHRKHAPTSDTAGLASTIPPVTPAAVSPAITGSPTADAKRDAGDNASGTWVRNANAAIPAIPATPATPSAAAPDEVAVEATPATPAVPAHKPVGVSRRGTGEATPGVLGGTAESLPQGSGTDAASASPPATSTPAAADAADGAAETIAAPPAAGSAATTGSSQAPDSRSAPARRDARARAASAAGRDSDAKAATTDGGPTGDHVLPAASDGGRARASLARIVAAGPDGVEEHTASGTDPAAASQTPASRQPSGFQVDAALAALNAARSAGLAPSGAAVTTATPAATAAALAADRLATDAIDRIRSTVRAGVPGLESRIDDPELGTIRIVVSARLGETIRAEIVARDPGAARELASGIDRALAAGALLPGNVDLRVRAETAEPSARADAHLGQGADQHARPQDQTFGGGHADGGAGGATGHARGHGAPPAIPAPEPARGRGRGLGRLPTAVSSTRGSLRPGTALDVRA